MNLTLLPPTLLSPASLSTLSSHPLARELSNHLWQSTLFAAAAALLALALRRYPARARYWLWLAASAKFLVPFSLLIAAGSHLTRPTHPTPTQTTAYLAIDEFSQPFTDSPALTAPALTATTPAPAPTPLLTLPTLLAALWLCGFLAILTRWLIQWSRVAAAIRHATPLLTGRVPETLRRIQHLARISRPIPVLSSPRSEFSPMEPGVFGVRRPILLWPDAISPHLDDAHLEAVLAHEAAHVRRRDNLTSLLHMLVEALFWFHPLVWWIETQLIKERERACDEDVLLLCHRPQAYAESILKVCELCIESPLTCVSGITGADLKRRIVQIMTAPIARKLGLGAKLLLLSAASLAIAAPILLGQMKAAQRMMLAAADAAPTPLRTAAHAMLSLEETPSTSPIAEADAQPPSTADATSPQAQLDAKPFAFDVVSIRPADPNRSGARRTRDTTDDGLLATNESLLSMLLRHHPELRLDANPIVGGPDWVRTLQWDIHAKVADSDVAEWSKLVHDSGAPAQARVGATIEAMLAERFKLRTHVETKEGAIYALVVAKGGPKLTPSALDAPPGFTMGQGHLLLKRGTTAGMVLLLARELGHPVIDKTGLTGMYDITLDWAPAQAAPSAPTADAGQASPPSDPSKPSLFTALQEQLGLKLEPQKGPIETLVIDHAEKPSIDGAELPNPPTPSLTPVSLVQSGPAPPPTEYYAAEQMQKANDLEASGKTDAAIQIYRQVLSSAPSRQFAAQAQFHLAQALLQKGDLQGAAQEFQVLSQSYPDYKDLVVSMTAQMRSGSPREYGVLVDGRFHHFQTDIELTIPDGYTFAGCYPSTGDGEQAILISQSSPNVEVWMRPALQPIADLHAELHRQVTRKPADRGEGWIERPESVQERSISGNPAISVVADYMNNGKPWVEYLIWIDTLKSHTQFFGNAEASQLALLQQSVDTVANSALIP
jgi:uncharacterized protein (TIGR03435 family)